MVAQEGLLVDAVEQHRRGALHGLVQDRDRQRIPEQPARGLALARAAQVLGERQAHGRPAEAHREAEADRLQLDGERKPQAEQARRAGGAAPTSGGQSRALTPRSSIVVELQLVLERAADRRLPRGAAGRASRGSRRSSGGCRCPRRRRSPRRARRWRGRPGCRAAPAARPRAAVPGAGWPRRGRRSRRRRRRPSCAPGVARERAQRDPEPCAAARAGRAVPRPDGRGGPISSSTAR